MAVSGDGRALVVWKESSETAEWLRAAVVLDGAMLAPTTIASGRYVEEPSVAYGGGVYLITWQSPSTVSGLRVALDGALLDARPFTISSRAYEPSSWFSQKPAVAWNGQRFLVAWTDMYIATTFVSADGSIGPTRQTGITGETPALAWNGERFVIAVTRVQWGLPFEAIVEGIHVATLEADGSSNGDDRLLMSGGRPSIAWGGGAFLVTAATPEQLDVAWLDRYGASLGKSFFLAPQPSYYSRAWKTASIDWNGSAFFVAAHSAEHVTFATFTLRVWQFAPGSASPRMTLTIASRPDPVALSSAALITVGAKTRVVYADVLNSDKYAEHPQLVIDSVRPSETRRRAVTRSVPCDDAQSGGFSIAGLSCS